MSKHRGQGRQRCLRIEARQFAVAKAEQAVRVEGADPAGLHILDAMWRKSSEPTVPVKAIALFSLAKLGSPLLAVARDALKPFSDRECLVLKSTVDESLSFDLEAVLARIELASMCSLILNEAATRDDIERAALALCAILIATPNIEALEPVLLEVLLRPLVEVPGLKFKISDLPWRVLNLFSGDAPDVPNVCASLAATAPAAFRLQLATIESPRPKLIAATRQVPAEFVGDGGWRECLRWLFNRSDSQFKSGRDVIRRFNESNPQSPLKPKDDKTVSKIKATWDAVAERENLPIWKKMCGRRSQ